MVDTDTKRLTRLTANLTQLQLKRIVPAKNFADIFLFRPGLRKHALKL